MQNAPPRGRGQPQGLILGRVGKSEQIPTCSLESVLRFEFVGWGRANRRKPAVFRMTKSVWIYVNPRRDYVKVFDSSDSALEWFQDHDPSGVAVQLPVEESQTPVAKPTYTDHQILIDAFLKARATIRDYVEDGKASVAVEQLMRILFNDKVLAAISRVDRRRRFGVIEGVRVRDDAG